ncbi:MAG: GAF domain-containing protein, partial [Proteobacteria bacterium]|nr:GAF domain-containing protein [Pseudomonadota bacterium]
PLDAGLIGWVAKHGRSIHVSPFDRSSATLGVYTTDQELKSFIGVPVQIETQPESYGVIACDSKKSFAFSKLQGKLLEELAEQVSCVVHRAIEKLSPSDGEPLSWEAFLRSGAHLLEAVGADSLQLMRVKTLNVLELEKSIGIGGTLRLLSQVVRLIQQTLPPGTPISRLANGDILLAVDNMMVSFYESRFEALAAHCREHGHRALLSYERLPMGLASDRSFESFVNHSLGVFQLEPERILNEHRRA